MGVVPASEISGVHVVELKVHPDPRGRFLETYRQEWFPGRPPMVQSNRSDSHANVLRGLHYHCNQADYWYVPRGRVFVGLADLRLGSPTEGEVAHLELGEGAELGLYIPPGVAHGYYAVTDATVTYQVDRTYDPSDELGVAWDDPALGIPWPCERPLLSERDQKNPGMAELAGHPRVSFPAS